MRKRLPMRKQISATYRFPKQFSQLLTKLGVQEPRRRKMFLQIVIHIHKSYFQELKTEKLVNSMQLCKSDEFTNQILILIPKSDFRNFKKTLILDLPLFSGVTNHWPDGFEQPKCVCRRVKIPKYVCLVARLGEQLLEKQVLKFILDIP